MSLQAVLIICLITLISSLCGVLGLWKFPVVVSLFIVFLGSVLFLSIQFLKNAFSQKKPSLFHVFLFSMFVFTVAFHFIGVLLPETGFDALWYHLPIIREYVLHHRLLYDQSFYQSLYPQYGDGVLLLGFGLVGVIGAKGISYLFFLLLVSTTYFWLRKKLAPSDALLGTFVMSLFHVVTWQSSSAYVDLISAVFFLWSVQFLISFEKKTSWVQLIVASLSTGIFIGTKFVNLGFIPLLLIITSAHFFIGEGVWKSKVKIFCLFWLVAFSTAFPWYLRAWWFTGNFLYPIGTIYAVPVIAQMGVTGWHEWFSLRMREVWKLPTDFFLYNDSYVTPLLFLFSPIIFVKKHFDKEFLLGLAVGIYGLCFWFFFPPPSTRYVLGPVVILWIVLFQKMIQTFEKSKWIYIIKLLCVANILFFLSLRVFISTRAIPYLMGWESDQQYLNRFRNGFTDEKIDSFYGKQK